MIDARHHGKGPVIFSWHPQGALLATSGSNRAVHIFTCHGHLLHTIKSLPSTRWGLWSCFSVCVLLEDFGRVKPNEEREAGGGREVFCMSFVFEAPKM